LNEIDQIRINFSSGELFTLDIALAIIMFGVALDIQSVDFKRLLQQPKIVLTGILSQFILMPALTFLIVIIAKPAPSIALGLIMVGACPGGNVSNYMSKLAKANPALSVSLTAFATLISVVMTPFNFEFWGSMYAPTRQLLKEVSLDPFALAKLVSLILGVPLVAGMLVRHYLPVWAEKIGKLLKPLSFLFFLILLVLAFHQNWDIFNKHIHYVFWIVVIHNLLAYVLGFQTARIFKLEFRERKTLAIETGIQNSGLGLLLIFGFFQGLGGMALLAAFWGVWDILSGLLLAFYWGMRENKELAKIQKRTDL
jgi:BASS family bile acid:Na+ symporter